MERRVFFERYRPTNLTVDPLPLKVLNHSIWDAEMPGHVLDWASQYLHQKSCPSYLISPLLGKVLEEMSKADLSDCYSKQSVARVDMDEVDADEFHNISYQPLKLMQSVTTKVDDICLRYKEENDHIETDFPIETTDGDKAPIFGASYYSIKNSRRTLEDRMVILPDINRVFNMKPPSHYFAVFDGHNGVEAAAYSAAHLHRYLFTSPDFPSDYYAAINYAFEATDTALLMKCKDENIRSGTTVVIALIVPGSIYIAWAGDSQAVLIRNAEATNLVSPHKPDREDELRRIKSVGGEVISIGGTWRVNGNLAVSRAIGNLDYKEYVTSTPEIFQIETNGSEEFLILACDGLWDVVSPQRCAEVIKNNLLSENPSDIDSVSQKLVIEAKQSGSSDNITVIVVLLKSKEDLIKLYSKQKPEKMNGSVEPAVAPVTPTKPVVESVAKSPATKPVASKATTASPTKGSPASKPSGTVNKSPLGLRNPPVSKAPVKAPERRPPTKAPLPATKPGLPSTRTTRDGVSATTKPAAPKPASTVTSRTQLTSRTVATTKKPLKTEETEKPVTTKTVVPPKPRPGTVPLSSRLTATTKTAAKVDSNKAGDANVAKESTATKRSVLNSARQAISKDGSASSRVASARQPAGGATTKPRVPSATTTAPKPATVSQPAKAAAPLAAAKKTVSSTTTSSAPRPPIKKPMGAVKKDVGKLNAQPAVPTKVERKISPVKSRAPAAPDTVGSPVGKVNGAGVVPTENGLPIVSQVLNDVMDDKSKIEAASKEIEVVSDVEKPITAETVEVVESSQTSTLMAENAAPRTDIVNENIIEIESLMTKGSDIIPSETEIQLEPTIPGANDTSDALKDLQDIPVLSPSAPIEEDTLASSEITFEASKVNSTLENEIEPSAFDDERKEINAFEAEVKEEPETLRDSDLLHETELTTSVPSDEGHMKDISTDEVVEQESSVDSTENVVNLEIAKSNEEIRECSSEVDSHLSNNDLNVFNGDFTGYVENFSISKSPEAAENELEITSAAVAKSEESDLIAPISNDLEEKTVSFESPEFTETHDAPPEIESNPFYTQTDVDHGHLLASQPEAHTGQNITTIGNEEERHLEDINFNYEQGLHNKSVPVEAEILEQRLEVNSSPFEEIKTNEDLPNQGYENIFEDRRCPAPSEGNDIPLNQQIDFLDELESKVDDEPDTHEYGFAKDMALGQLVSEEQQRGAQEAQPLEASPESNVDRNASSQSFDGIDAEYGQNFLNESQQPLLDCSTAESNNEGDFADLVARKDLPSQLNVESDDLIENFVVPASEQHSGVVEDTDYFKLNDNEVPAWSIKEQQQDLSQESAKLEQPSEFGVSYAIADGSIESARLGGSPFQLDVNAPEFTPTGFNIEAAAFIPNQGFDSQKGDLTGFEKAFGTMNIQEQNPAFDAIGSNGTNGTELDLSTNGHLSSANPFLIDTPFVVNGDKLSGNKNEIDIGSQLPSGFQDPLLDTDSASSVPNSDLNPSSEVTHTIGSEAKDDFAIFNH